jgi:hypothetical protein
MHAAALVRYVDMAAGGNDKDENTYISNRRHRWEGNGIEFD